MIKVNDLANLRVLHEDNHLIAVEKPAGILVHEDITEDIPLTEYVKQYIKIRYNKPGQVFLGVIHRLDRPVSGLILFARTSKALKRMNQSLKDREIEKQYLAITIERPSIEVGELTNFLVKDKDRNKVKVLEKPSRRNPDAKKAILRYELLGSVDGRHLLLVHLKTGRPHQIRAQLAAIGCPIDGDVKYGAPYGIHDATIRLHSFRMAFMHPVKKEAQEIFCPPNDIKGFGPFIGLLEDHYPNL